ncbi:MAG: ABC transporter substrate-binding protein [Bacteroidia bacterium]|nr:ABC transporter substrate-binding protein [Bacteroidia bacterium]
MYSQTRKYFPLLLVLSLILQFSCGPKQVEQEQPITTGDQIPEQRPDSLQKVVLLPYWVTTAQFAGYYVGKERGIFARHGIDLEVMTFQTNMEMQEMIRNQVATFYIFWLVNAIEYKASGLDIVNIAQLSSRSSLMLLTKKKSGIEIIRDMEGKRAAIWAGFELQPQALFKKNKVNVKIIPIGSSNNLFLSDGVEIINASWFDEYHTIINSGYNEDELETFFFADHGLNFLEDGIYTMQSTLDADPGLCKQFVEATLESWKYAFDHPEETVDIVLARQRKQKIPASLAHQRWMLERYHDLYYPEGKTFLNTSLKKSEYRNNAKVLLEAGLIEEIPPFHEFFIPVISAWRDL